MGLVFAISIWTLWAGHLLLALFNLVPGPLPLHVLLQAQLATGLFITAHDALHGSVSSRRWLNHAVGGVSAFLFAGISYRRLARGHAAHHRAPTSSGDPDFSPHGFWRWWLTFLIRYATVSQLALMAVAFNGLKRFVPESRIWLFFVIPPVLASLQLFTFGTYLPHRPPYTAAMSPHSARSQRRNHPWAMLSCYFFGYHWEHHQSPGTPWWRLWRLKTS